MVLVDTSVWIDHFRKSSVRLITLLKNDFVVIHPFVIGELACGNLKKRDQVLDLLQKLPNVSVIDQQEVIGYIDKHKLFGQGLGIVDVNLLVSAEAGRFKLWTLDRKLHSAASFRHLAL